MFIGGGWFFIAVSVIKSLKIILIKIIAFLPINHAKRRNYPRRCQISSFSKLLIVNYSKAVSYRQMA
jgi:hypothetical protein